MKSGEKSSFGKKLISTIGLYTLVSSLIFILGFYFENGPHKPEVSFESVIYAPIRLLKSVVCSFKKQEPVGPYLNGLIHLIRTFNPFDDPSMDQIIEDEVIVEQKNETIVIDNIIYHSLDQERIEELRKLIKSIRENQENLDKMLDSAGKEVNEIKEIVKSLNPNVTKEDITEILNDLSNFNKNVDEIVDAVVKQISSTISGLWKMHEVDLTFSAPSELSEFGGPFTKDIVTSDRELKQFIFKPEHFIYVGKIYFDALPSNANHPSDIDINFISKGSVIDSKKENVLISDGKRCEILFAKPVLCDAIVIKVNGYQGAGDRTVLPVFHVLETAIGASK